jgi:hypothetical protein
MLDGHMAGRVGNGRIFRTGTIASGQIFGRSGSFCGTNSWTGREFMVRIANPAEVIQIGWAGLI